MKNFVCKDFVSLDLYRYGKFRGVLFEHMPIDFAYDYLRLKRWKFSLEGKTYHIRLRDFRVGSPLKGYNSFYDNYCRHFGISSFDDWTDFDDCVSIELYRRGEFRGFLVSYIPVESAITFCDTVGKVFIDGKGYHLRICPSVSCVEMFAHLYDFI